jgi:hypothetical protein
MAQHVRIDCHDFLPVTGFLMVKFRQHASFSQNIAKPPFAASATADLTALQAGVPAVFIAWGTLFLVAAFWKNTDANPYNLRAVGFFWLVNEGKTNRCCADI